MKYAVVISVAFASLCLSVCEAIAGNKQIQKQASAKLVPADPDQGMTFGYSVGVSGDYAIVGAVGDESQGKYSGSAYVFHRTGADSWDQGVKLIPQGTTAADWVGCSVDVDGDFAVVAACEKDLGNGSTVRDAGGVYVYQRTGLNDWGNAVLLTSPDMHADQQFGKSVSIGGDYLVVGARWDGSAAPNAGAAYVFHRTGANLWDAGVRIVAPDSAAGVQFGYAVSISGDYLVVGAVGEDGAARNAGAAYIFHRTGLNAWDSVVKIVASDAQSEDRFGISVGIDGDYAVVGARDAGDNGVAYIYGRTGENVWDMESRVEAPDGGASFGEAVAISGDRVAVGAPAGAGGVYVFARNMSDTWDFEEKLLPSEVDNGDRFGCSVSIDGDRIVSGAKTDSSIDTGVGAVYAE